MLSAQQLTALGIDSGLLLALITVIIKVAKSFYDKCQLQWAQLRTEVTQLRIEVARLNFILSKQYGNENLSPKQSTNNKPFT